MIKIPRHKRHKPPSQIRYEKSHPTISFRLDEVLKARLRKVLEKESFADFVKEGLGKREHERESLDDSYKKGYDKGYNEGYKKAKDRFVIDGECSVCGGSMEVVDERAKEKVVRFLLSEGWGHKSCIERTL